MNHNVDFIVFECWNNTNKIERCRKTKNIRWYCNVIRKCYIPIYDNVPNCSIVCATFADITIHIFPNGKWFECQAKGLSHSTAAASIPSSAQLAAKSGTIAFHRLSTIATTVQDKVNYTNRNPILRSVLYVICTT